MTPRWTIGRAAKRAGCTVQTVRYYEQIGVLPAPSRSQGNQRLYTDADIDRLTFVRHARDLGFSLEAVRDLMSLADDPDQPCEAAHTIASAQLVDVEARIARLQALKVELQRMVAQCRGGAITDCRVIGVLGDHAQCLTPDHEHPSAAPT